MEYDKDKVDEMVWRCYKTYPHLHLTIERQIAEGEWVATCITANRCYLDNYDIY